MEKVYLLIGGNLGNRESNIHKAHYFITDKIGEIVLKSSIYQTAPWGNTNQPQFLNQVLVCQTALNPQQVLARILEIEAAFKRVKHEKWGARTMDIDILFYNDCVVDTPNLIIPHTLLAQRRFALKPLSDVAPLFIHPILNTTVAQLLLNCEDDLEVLEYVAEV